MIGGFGITGPGDHYIAPERRCAECGLLLGERETSPCDKCEGARLWLGDEHMRRVHGDGSDCPDGCDMAVLA